MFLTTETFKENAVEALGNEQLQRAMHNVEAGFIGKRKAAADRLPEFDQLRANARDIKNHTLAHLDLYLEAYEANLTAAGGLLHFARNSEEARSVVLDICKRVNARTVTKGKSMISEEINLNEALSAAGVDPIETDLGEYIIQLRGEHPSHIIAPAVHVLKEQVEADFRRVHTHLAPERNLDEPESLLGEARAVLRDKFLKSARRSGPWPCRQIPAPACRCGSRGDKAMVLWRRKPRH
jgi:L-lactate dehydrogenase complex protein LldF